MEWAARAIGVFYVFGGLMLVGQAWLNWRLERALAGLARPSLAERLCDGVVALGGGLVLASGLSLALLSPWAVGVFLAGWTVQAVYLLCFARWAREAALATPRARRRSLHPFAGYTAVTALVLWLPALGLLT